jgi:hypothetical protein
MLELSEIIVVGIAFQDQLVRHGFSLGTEGMSHQFAKASP